MHSRKNQFVDSAFEEKWIVSGKIDRRRVLYRFIVLGRKDD